MSTADDHARAQALLDELYRLNGADTLGNPTQTPATRIQIRTADGQLVGEALLSARSTDETTLAIGAVAEYALVMPADYQAGRGTPTPKVDDLLMADIEDHFADLDLDDLTRTALNGAAPSERLAVTRAIDDMFGHIPHWDAEDGDL
ncbi:hypothetical protein [Streptomyces rubiginosohelvolus]|uniref:Uncharacterized protein n=1 Tax=Streptomyces rubiginosohelvolus TaxID=67362 RepID=A0ABQ3CCA4_9ACTN|nr:hypothetical protein [Streptomyces pluricolorescens]GGZ82741.1 hypothetical protein GCM10010328_66450 [Streptomyces pluricolorescens]